MARFGKIGKVFLVCALLGLLASTQALELIPSNLQNDMGDALEAIFSMGFKLENLLHPNTTQPENFLVSPLSLTLLLGQLMVGAEGKFRDHLYDLVQLRRHPGIKQEDLYMRLHLQLGNLLRRLKMSTDRHYTLDSNNALFVNKKVSLKESFVHDSKTLYHTDIFPLNFRKSQDAMKKINNWAFEHTNGLVKSIVDAPPGSNTAGIFANAIYFYGKWEQPFSNELNHQAPFFTSNSTSHPVTYMVNFLESVPYAESKRLNCKLLVLPYENRELGMYMVLPNVGHPNEYDVSAFATQAKLADYLQMLGDLQNHDVNVKVPKFSMTSSLSLLKPLQMYATYKKFMEGRSKPVKNNGKAKNVLDDLEDKQAMFANFKSTFHNNSIDEIMLSAASYGEPLKVSDVLQHMTFAFNEVGTEAAAVSAGVVDYSGGQKTFNANKPFIFFIRHEATAATLFWGTMSNPM